MRKIGLACLINFSFFYVKAKLSKKGYWHKNTINIEQNAKQHTNKKRASYNLSKNRLIAYVIKVRMTNIWRAIT